MESVPGVPKPVGRSYHAACCLNYGEDHIKVLISGGIDKDLNVLKDMWLMDIKSGRWTEVRRLQHSSCTTY